jgi:ABC-2 type transport system ATP-binding protein
MKNTYSISVKNLRKSYGNQKVLKGIDLQVKQGTILALLGPNGAGKTTTVRILSTLIGADGGTATIEGKDVEKQSSEVRALIGLTGQYAAVDEYLTGEENVQMMGRLYKLSMADAAMRSKQLIEQFDLVEAGKRPVRTYSGGMKRRLDLAMSLVANPPVLFLDEPTTGLDPRSRLALWGMIKQLAKNGTTILLTTQYMDEADYLADNIVVIDGGKVIAEGNSNDLKAKIGSDRLELTIANKSGFQKAKSLIRDDTVQTDAERRIVSVASKGGVKRLKEILQTLETAKVEVESVSLHRPTLDDVFLTLTGHAASADDEAEKSKGKK